MDFFDWHLRSPYDDDTASDRDMDNEPLSYPYVVCSAISCDAFLRMLECSDRAPPRWQFEPNLYGTGRVMVYSAPTLVHEQTAGAIIASIRDQVIQIGDDPTLENALRLPASLVCRLGDRLQAPDDALVPADAAKDSFPTLVVDIAYTNETLAMLQTRLARWVHGPSRAPHRRGHGVQVAIGVKICTTTTKRTIVVMQPDKATQVVEIGGTGNGRARGWQLRSSATVATFPLGALFRGFTLPLALRGLEHETILIDSDEVRGVVLCAQRTMRRRGRMLP